MKKSRKVSTVFAASTIAVLMGISAATPIYAKGNGNGNAGSTSETVSESTASLIITKNTEQQEKYDFPVAADQVDAVVVKQAKYALVFVNAPAFVSPVTEAEFERLITSKSGSDDTRDSSTATCTFYFFYRNSTNIVLGTPSNPENSNNVPYVKVDWSEPKVYINNDANYSVGDASKVSHVDFIQINVKNEETVVTPEEPETPAVTPEEPETPAVTPEEPETPAVTPEEPETPAVTPEEPETPAVTPEEPETPAVTPEEPETPAVTPEEPETPAVTPEEPETPAVTPEEPETPAVTPEEPETPAVTPEEPETPAVTPEEPETTTPVVETPRQTTPTTNDVITPEETTTPTVEQNTNTPKTNTAVNNRVSTPKTGDETNSAYFLGMMSLSLCTAFAVVVLKRKYFEK